MSEPISVIVASDPHAGGSTGLLPPHGAKLDEGNVVLPNLWQEWSWKKWLECWDEVKQLTKKTKRIVILNGDLVDGFHHGTWQVITANPTIQRRIALEVLSPVKDLEPYAIYVVRGTAAHAGEQANNEEEIAQSIGAVKDEVTGSHSRWKLNIEVLGKRVQAFHHGKIGTYKWSEQAAMDRMAWKIRSEYDNAGFRPPDVVFVAHQHKWGKSNEFSCPTRVVMSPGWQGATQYSHRVAAETAGIVPVGMWIALFQEGAEPALHAIRRRPREAEVEVVG